MNIVRPGLKVRVVAFILAGTLCGCAGSTVPKTSIAPGTSTASPQIYIADGDGDRIARIDDMRGTGWVSYGVQHGPKIPAPTAIYVDSEKHIYAGVRKSAGNLLRQDDMLGTNQIVLGNLGTGNLNPWIVVGGMAVDSLGRIYLTDEVNYRIIRINDMSGDGMVTYGTSGSGVGRFQVPYGIAVDSSFHIYIADLNNSRIVRIDDMTGKNWTALGGTQGSGVGHFGQPYGLCLDNQGRIYVSDIALDRIVRVDDITGAGWTTFGDVGTRVDQFNRPFGLFVDDSNRIYIADHDNSRIVRIDDMAGDGWTTFGTNGTGSGQFLGPYSVYVR